MNEERLDGERPVWKVYQENYNQKCIEEYNIFDFDPFWTICQIHWIQAHDLFPDDNEQALTYFAEMIIHDLRNFFWDKKEYGIALTSLFFDNFENKKVDIYSQIALNMDAFIMYIGIWFYKKESKKNG